MIQIINPYPWAIHDPSKGGLKKTNAQNKAGNAAKVKPIPYESVMANKPP